MSDVDKQTALVLIDNQLKLWQNTRFDLQIQVKVSQSIGDGEERIEALRKELVRCEKAIEKLGALRIEEAA